MIGLFVGLAGGSFSVGTPYVARWFPQASARAWRWACTARAIRARRSTSSSPRRCVVAFGWTMVPQVYAAIMLGTVLLFWFFSYSDPRTWCPAT